MKKDRDAETLLTGYVSPVDWSTNGNVSEVEIVGDDGKEYLVERSGKGLRLAEHVDGYIQVSGTVSKDEDEYTVKVLDFDVLESPEYEDWDEDDDYY